MTHGNISVSKGHPVEISAVTDADGRHPVRRTFAFLSVSADSLSGTPAFMFDSNHWRGICARTD